MSDQSSTQQTSHPPAGRCRSVKQQPVMFGCRCSTVDSLTADG